VLKDEKTPIGRATQRGHEIPEPFVPVVGDQIRDAWHYLVRGCLCDDVACLHTTAILGGPEFGDRQDGQLLQGVAHRDQFAGADGRELAHHARVARAGVITRISGTEVTPVGVPV